MYLINFHNGNPEKNIPSLDIEEYPSLKIHFDNYYQKLVARADQGDSPYNLRSCAYLDNFNRPKICWNRIASKKQFAIIPTGYYILDSMHFINGDKLKYLCSILNSKLIQWLLNLIIGDAAGGNAGNADNVLNIPAPNSTLGDVMLSDKQVFNIYGLSTKEIEYIEKNTNN